MVEKKDANRQVPANDDPASFVQVRRKAQDRVRQAPFAGRIGGNQEFVELGDDEESEAILKRQPDAVWPSARSNYGPRLTKDI